MDSPLIVGKVADTIIHHGVVRTFTGDIC